MKSLVVAAHPDDETLGAGGAILRRKAEGRQTAWLIITGISTNHGWSDSVVDQRRQEINLVTKLLKFDEVYQLELPAAKLDEMPLRDLVKGIADVFSRFKPNEIFVPHYSDVHSDHRVVFQAVASCSKWFRYPFLQRVLCYETLSETDFGLGDAGCFKPNYFLDVGPYMEKKLEAMRVYKSELDQFPFPRSIEAMKALAYLRGAASGFTAAEAFELLRERG